MSILDRDATTVAVPTRPDAGVRASASSWRRGALRALATLVTVAIAAALGWFGWQAYMGTPWTRDGTVRAYVVTIAPEVAGQIVNLPVADNAFVHKGDLLMQVDPASYTIAVRQAEAGVEQAKAAAQNAEAEWARRQKLNDLAVTLEEQQTYAAKSLSAGASYETALANLDNARLNLHRTRIVSPVNGYVTNLQARSGDYANVGQRQVSLIDAEFLLGRRLFRGDVSRIDPRRRRGHGQAHGLPASASGPCPESRARHQRPERDAVRAGPRHSQSDFRFRSARPAGPGPYPSQLRARRRPAGGGYDGDGRDRSPVRPRGGWDEIREGDRSRDRRCDGHSARSRRRTRTACGWPDPAGDGRRERSRHSAGALDRWRRDERGRRPVGGGASESS